MILAVTGHRPEKLLGYGLSAHERLTVFAVQMLEEFKPTSVVTGMALGWDQAIAQAAYTLGIPFVAAIPCPNQARQWPAESVRLYDYLITRATNFEIISPRYDAGCMQRRNEWMVDRSNELLSLWNGSAGGTRNCREYALAKGRSVWNVWDEFQKFKTA